MRSNVLTRTVIGLTAVVGLTTGTVAAAGTSFAASQPAAKTAVSTQDVSILAVNNLGLNTTRAKNWQCFLRGANYNPGTIDGQLGTSSWKAAQRLFNDWGYNAGTVDGAVGTNTIKALQRFLGVTPDGVAGSNTKAAFWNFNATGC
ncbi:peptidoglycan-binding domain-containing protein [Streptomyces sp. NPDC054884]|uniref:peptidoglycan-binding domain-containing protein n=1 Tax=Streptomyces sp. ME08-AFT2 TaxID=3028683 RepID=UPI0029BB9BE0|nr:peptidoglycan-binding domain-containing protein [Streptomyces sp. ME08-AFT2]MDX3314928.1 peptidoglycan-binding domain-containing protein [Streptomyces sp. ME08-AFT2]